MDKCEMYDFSKNTWSAISPMTVKRCTSSAFVYKDLIYVIGGYTGHAKSSKKVLKHVFFVDFALKKISYDPVASTFLILKSFIR